MTSTETAIVVLVTILGLIVTYYVWKEALAWIKAGKVGFLSDEDFLEIWGTEKVDRHHEQDKLARTCPVERGGCGGRWCFDWVKLRRPCHYMPTRAEETAALVGRHYHSTVQKAAEGWWPIPRTEAAKSRPDLWERAAGHLKIGLYTGRRFALP